MRTYFSNIKKRIKELLKARNFLIALLILLLIITIWWFFSDLSESYYRGELRPHFKNNYNSVDKIQLWMTFDYLNFTFHLPPDYLHNALKIDDSHYPKIRLGQYAKKIGVNQEQFLQTIKEIISRY